MGWRVLKLLIWVLFISNFTCFSIEFTPQDMYLVDCGSANDTTMANRTYISDQSASKYLSTSQNILATTTSNSITASADLPLYQTARIFTQASSYKFRITHAGRVWIRLYLFPFVYNNFNMSYVNFSVSTGKNSLLSNFSPKNLTMKEFSVSATTGDFFINFAPSNNSFAFINALEVVSAPDSLITDDAFLINELKW